MTGLIDARGFSEETLHETPKALSGPADAGLFFCACLPWRRRVFPGI